MSRCYRIVIPFATAASYLPEAIRSVRRLTGAAWQAYLIDDLSQDDSLEVARREVASDSRFTILANSRKLYVPGNYLQVLALDEVRDEDVILCLDGDDYLPDGGVLERVDSAYRDPHIWLTWGSYRVLKGSRLRGRGVSRYVRDVRQVRSLPWRTSHLRTFKAHLLRRVREQDLLNPSRTAYWEAAGDLAMMFPMLEMAGNRRVRYLVDVNYIYRADNPLSDALVQGSLQREYERLLRAMPPYDLI